jgi:hypothetical protein
MAFYGWSSRPYGDQHAYSHLYRPFVLVSVCVNLDMDNLSGAGAVIKVQHVTIS